MTKIYLLDVNVWLALAFQRHEHHLLVAPWFQSLDDELCVFCRTTQQAFLRLSTNRAAFKDDTLTLNEAWTNYELLLNDSKVGWIAEPPGIDAHWRRLTNRDDYSTHVWMDAYLASFAIASDIAIATLDKAMTQYDKLECIVLG